ncbi:MAG: hypothetical protein AAF353_01105 [Pseudomonadota bacterium]
MNTVETEQVSQALQKSWSLASSSKWKESNPALGQCGVTALVAQDFLGGEIVKTWVSKPDVGELWHYYNLIDNRAIDFTISQFDEPIKYDGLQSSREEAFRDATPHQYKSLSARVSRHLNSL